MKKLFVFFYLLVIFLSLLGCDRKTQTNEIQKPPNILLVISDDQSYPHAGAYGYKAVKTPAFDRIANEGMLFTNAFVASPGCSPSRAALLTGRNCWQLENAGTHASTFPAKYVVYPDLLEGAGYFVGFTGKGWGPGDHEASGRKRNPAGNTYSEIHSEDIPEWVASVDYSSNFSKFLSEKPADKPFCFWLGTNEPHRPYKKGIGVENGKSLEDIEVPNYLPDTPEIRGDIADYLFEIEWFDTHLAKVLKTLEEVGELENTLIVVTSDNGMPFPRAKANVYEAGIHVPLAIRWGKNIKAGSISEELISLTDIAPTFLAAAGVTHPSDSTGLFSMTGKDLSPLLKGEVNSLDRKGVYSSRERHSYSRWNNNSYPQRALRTQQFLLIKNYTPERWPSGDPRRIEEDGKLSPPHSGYHDIDKSPTLDFLVQNHSNSEFSEFFHWAVDKRPSLELFDIRKDPYCLYNLANNPEYNEIRKGLMEQMDAYLASKNDPRFNGDDVFETYPRLRGPMRKFPEE